MRMGQSQDPAAPQLVRATLPGGRRATLYANLGPLLDHNGRLTGVLFAAEDRSEELGSAAESPEHGAEERRLIDALRRYLGEGIAHAVVNRASFVGLGGVAQQVSVLHADVRGYTTVAEALPPAAVTELLLRFHGAAVRALQGEGATLDRFIGDAVLAIWNAPQLQPGHVRMALRGALALRAATMAQGTELGYGVGVHTGEAVVGNLGSEEFMNYTAVGDTVNIAARLQAAAAVGEVVCSGSALAAAGPGIHAVSLGLLTVKGRTAPVEAYRVDGMEAGD